MTPNPVIGILLHAIGGFAAGSFYSPLKKIRGWSWETAWLMMGVAAWLAAPWIAALSTTPQLHEIISQAFAANSKAIGWAILFGFIWGFGNVWHGQPLPGNSVGWFDCSRFLYGVWDAHSTHLPR